MPKKSGSKRELTRHNRNNEQDEQTRTSEKESEEEDEGDAGVLSFELKFIPQSKRNNIVEEG